MESSDDASLSSQAEERKVVAVLSVSCAHIFYLFFDLGAFAHLFEDHHKALCRAQELLRKCRDDEAVSSGTLDRALDGRYNLRFQTLIAFEYILKILRHCGCYNNVKDIS
jgi:hypothetical protein